MDSGKTPANSVSHSHHPIQPEQQVKPVQVPEPSAAQQPVDDWACDCAVVEDKFFSALNTLLESSVKEKTELKKPLADLYRQAHDLMTRYNQRVQNLILDDRFLYRHATEISALMIRGLMPPLENIKALEKSITSTSKKSAKDALPDLQDSSRVELQKLTEVFQDVRSRLDRYTKPLSVEQQMQKRLEQRLQQEASELQQQIEPALVESVARAPVVEPSTRPQLTKVKSRPPSVDDLGLAQLQVLADRLDHPEGQKGVLAYVESEYEHFAVLGPFLSVAQQKCRLMSMNPDRACVVCQQAIERLGNTLANSESPLSLATLVPIDHAIGKLMAFDKKLPGEVWQLFTELSPDQTDARYHLLNLLCRKLLLDGPALLTRKAALHQFRAIEQLFSMLAQEVGQEAFDRAFMTVFGQAFSSLAQLKKALSVANKPHEVQALLALFARQHSAAQLADELAKLTSPEDDAVRRGVAAGIAAFECLVNELPAQLAIQINDYRPFETNPSHGQLSQSLLAKFADYYQALELTRLQQEASPTGPVGSY